MFLTVTTGKAEDRRKLSAKLSGGGAGASVSASAVAEAVSTISDTRIAGDMYAVGGILPETGIDSAQKLMKLVDDFAPAVARADAGTSMRLTSYYALVAPEKRRPFGIPGRFVEAARTYDDLGGLWQQMREVIETPALVDTSRSVPLSCIGTKADEVLDLRAELKQPLETCGAALAQAPGQSYCEGVQVPRGEDMTSDAACPPTPVLLGDRGQSVYDYLVMLPAPKAGGPIDTCRLGNGFVDRVYDTYVRPVVAARCKDRPEDHPECRSDFEARAKAAVPRLRAPLSPPLPTGSWARTCRKPSISLVSDGKMRLTTECHTRKDFWGNQKWLKATRSNLPCPPRYHLINCDGKLIHDTKCP